VTFAADKRHRLVAKVLGFGCVNHDVTDKRRRPKPPPVSLSCSEGLQVVEKLEDTFRAGGNIRHLLRSRAVPAPAP
jgi:hypothetical protein